MDTPSTQVRPGVRIHESYVDNPAFRGSAKRKLIADAAQVSLSAVNRFCGLKSRKYVSQTMINTIQAACTKHKVNLMRDGSPAVWARGLAIGYTSPRPYDIDRIDNAIWARQFTALQYVLEARGLQLRSFALSEDPSASEAQGRAAQNAATAEWVGALLAVAAVDAYVFNDPVVNDPRLDWALKAAFPFVVMGSPVDLRSNPRQHAEQMLAKAREGTRIAAQMRPAYAKAWRCVDLDDTGGFMDLTRLLIRARGCRNLLHITFANDGTFPGPRRQTGVHLAVMEAWRQGLRDLEEPHILALDYAITPREAVHTIREHLHVHPQIDGVIAASDRFALHSQQALDLLNSQQRPNRPARGMEFAGCDDDPVRRSSLKPWLSLATPHLAQSGKLADALLGRFAQASSPEAAECTLLPALLVGLEARDRAWLQDVEGYRMFTTVGDRQ